MIEVELPDGSVIDVDAPDASAAAAAAHKYWTQKSAPKSAASLEQFGPPQPPAPPLYHGTEPQAVNAGRSEQLVQAGVQGSGRGVADIIGMGPDIVNAGVNLGLAGLDWASQKAGGPALPFRFGSVSNNIADLASRAATEAGIPVLDPTTLSDRERLTYNVNRYGTQAALMSPALATAAVPRAAAIRDAGAAAKAVGKPISAAPRLGDTLLRPYVGESVGKTVVGDLAAGVGAGGAVSALEQSPMKDWPGAAVAAPILGGLGGVTALAMLRGGIGGLARLAGRPFGAGLDKGVTSLDEAGMPVHPSAKATDRAAEFIQRRAALPPEEASNFLTRNRAMLSDYLPELPTSFQLTEDPGLAALDQQLALRQGGGELLRNQRFRSGVRDVVDQVVPAGAAPEDLVRRAEQEAAARMAAAEGRQATVEGRQARVADIQRQQGQAVAEQRGGGIPASEQLHTSLVERSYVPERAFKNEQFRAIDPERNIMVDTRPLAEAATKVRESINALGPQRDQFPAEFVQKFETLFPGGKEISVQAPAGDIAELRMYLSKAYEQAQKTGNFKLADNVSALRQAISNTIKDVPAAAEAQQTYKAFADVFRPNRTDPMARFTREIDRGAEPPPSQTASRFLRPNQPETSAALGRWVGTTNDPEALQAVRSYLLSDLAESGAVDAKTGALKPEVVARWQQKHAANIDLVPGLGDEIGQMVGQAQKGERVAGKVAEQVRAAQAGVKRTQTEIDKGALGLVIGADADKAVKAVMDNSHRSGRLLNELIDLTAKDPAARNGLKAAVHQYIIDKATTTASETLLPGDRRGPVSPAKLSKIFSEHEKELAQIFTSEEMNGLRAGHEALQIANSSRLRALTGSDTAEKMNAFNQLMDTPLGRGIDAALRLKFGMLKGGGIMALARRQLSPVTSPMFEETTRIVEQARKDPELLLLLMGRKIPVGSPAWNARLNTLLGVATGAREVND